ncbi:YceD family protein [Stutzerimonas frequens]|uniref:YceD family protein n=1 Tax=Stutzerimonas frequens TaxID=2968969 RepID=UPI0012E1390A|nr:YceD family protein [Stutzerimonas frequens]MCD1640656.1 YceD family protein [Stutzerimonas stutzeri]MUT69182.1 metal-binding protein [Stutzerimonas frequens]WCR43545.1 YceD family protein [Stutzerimonas stutzeri]WOC78423.1 YceD family protein [Stutzerimonas frequens]WRW25697.1 YceD family protein [Stutzerimonas frequens]
MLKGPIPPHVDPRKLADRAATLEGELQLSQLKRLADPLEDDQGVVRASFVFGRDEQRTVVIHSQLDVEVKMICQRCLEPVVLPIHSECDYAVVNEGASSQHLPKGYDVLEVGEDPLDLLALVEDELLLALPIVPLHDPEICQPPVGPDEPEPSEDEVTRSNPFSVLAQLKRDPNV